MSSIFMSYSVNDERTAEQLETVLHDSGVTVWRDQHDLHGGQLWPKELGEAIARQDVFLLLWSKESATSHFVEFEWTTALALKLPVIPCKLDATPLPAALRAVHAVSLTEWDNGIQQVLSALQAPPPLKTPDNIQKVIAALAEITQQDPKDVVSLARAIFAQDSWSVQGNVYQAAGNIVIQGTQREIPDKPKIDTWIKVVGVVATLLTIVISGITIYEKVKPKVSPSQPPVPKIVLRGIVKSSHGEPLGDTKVSLRDENGRSVTTTSDGGFYFANLSGASGDRVRVFVTKSGYKTYNEYVILPGPARIVVEEQL